MSRFVRGSSKFCLIFVMFLLFFSFLNILVVVDGASSVVYFDAHPYIQGQNGFVSIICIIDDDSDIQKVEAIVTSPKDVKTEETMLWDSDGKYVYTDTYRDIGRYSFYIRIVDVFGNDILTKSKFFWVTLNLDDTDGDGMPDWWEEKYGFNPEYVVDAYGDADGDGYTNREEYETGTNPVKDTFMQNAAYKIRENDMYLGGSVFLFIVLILLSIYGKRRAFR